MPEAASITKFRKRKDLWEALSMLYLDTDLTEETLRIVAAKIKAADYAYSEVISINLYEVFPYLYQNLIIPAGNWADFDKRLLHSQCLGNYKKKHRFGFKVKTQFLKIRYRWIYKEVERVLNVVYE